MKVIVIGASYCPPCQILKDWLAAGGISGVAEYQYAELLGRDTFALIDKVRQSDPDFAKTIPAVYIEDDNGVVTDWLNGATQSWIKLKLGMSGGVPPISPIPVDSYVDESGPQSNPDDAPDEILFMEWIEDETFGIENEILLYGGLALFVIIIAYVLNKAGWLK